MDDVYFAKVYCKEVVIRERKVIEVVISVVDIRPIQVFRDEA